MFTGIVETIGTVSSLSPDPTSGTTVLTIKDAGPILDDCHLGDSISVDGTCLTVTSFTPTPPTFSVGLAPETLSRTTLSTLQPGSRVNLERAVRATTRLGGHMVQGHVDTVGTVAALVAEGESRRVRVAALRDPRVLRYVVVKGFVAVDGASLTVTAVGDGWFEFVMVEYTRAKLSTGAKRVGDVVNVEVDCVGKYVERGVEAWVEGGEGGILGDLVEKVVERVVERRLKELGTGRGGSAAAQQEKEFSEN